MTCSACDALPPAYAFRLALEGEGQHDGSHNKALCASCNRESAEKAAAEAAAKDSSGSGSGSKSAGKRPAKHKWVSWELQLNGELVVRT